MPERSPPPPLPVVLSSLLPQAATPSARTAAEATTTSHLELDHSVSFSFVHSGLPALRADLRRQTLSGLAAACYLRCIEDVKKM